MFYTTGSITNQLASLYTINNQQLADTLSRIASGKKVQKPSDDYVAYLRARSLQDDIDAYSDVTKNLTEAKEVGDLAVEIGTNIYDDLVKMKKIATLYATASDEDKAAYNIEFKALATSISDLISTNKYDSLAIVSDNILSTVEFDPEDDSNTISLEFDSTDITDIAANASEWHLDLVDNVDPTPDEPAKDADDVQDEIEKALSYLNKAENFQTRVNRQLDLTDTIVQNKGSLQSLLTNINEVEELNNQTTLQIRQQATVAMIAQANMLQSSLTQLFSAGIR